MHLFISFALEKKQEKRKIVHFYPTKNHFQKKCKKKETNFCIPMLHCPQHTPMNTHKALYK